MRYVKLVYFREICLIGLFLLPVMTDHTFGQIYSPTDPFSMWDTWLYHEENDYHLFFLQSEPEIIWNTIGRAVSRDLVHWQPLPSIPSKGPQGSWDENPTLTGMTIKVDSGYILFYGSDTDGQKIGTMYSSDLQHWQKNHRNPLLQPRAPYYSGTDWRDMFIYYNLSERQWHGFVCAQTPKISEDSNAKNIACIAHLTTKNFTEWNYLPPVYTNSDFSNMEVPDYFEMSGYHYLLFSNAATVQNTSGRKNARGTYYIMSNKRDGPYHLPPAPLLLGSGMGRFDVYVGRTILYENKRLLYHQTVGGKVSWGIPKIIRQNKDGTLWLEYWHGFDKLEKSILPEDFSKVISNNITGKGIWRKQGNSVFGETPANQKCVLWLPVLANDAMITCEIKMDMAEKTGLVWKWNNQSGEGLLIDKNKISLCKLSSRGNTLSSELADEFQGFYAKPGYQHMRIILRGQRVEVYVNDHWVFGTLMNPGREGRIGLYLESGKSIYKDICITELESMESGYAKSLKDELPEENNLEKRRMNVLTNPSIQRDRSGWVTITSSDADNKFYYSINGAGYENSQNYREQFLFPNKGTITAWIGSEISQSGLSVSTTFDQLRAVKPEINPSQAYFDQNTQVRLSTPLDGARIHYTLDGSRPSEKSSIYQNPIKIDQKTILRTISIKDGFIPSDENTSKYQPISSSSGLKYYFYEGNWSSTPDYFSLTPMDSGFVSQIRLEKISLTKNESYALLFHGFIKIEQEGIYTFYTASNDGSQLSVNSYKVVDNDGAHGLKEKSGKIYLNKGIHLIEVRYFQMGGGQGLCVSYEGPGINKQEIPASIFTGLKN
jgi:hypothetical protein